MHTEVYELLSWVMHRGEQVWEKIIVLDHILRALRKL